MRIYIAAPLACGYLARHAADSLRAERHTVLSTWHEIDRSGDPLEHGSRLGQLAANLSELDAADVVVALMSHGTPRATNVEIGYAIARGKRVVWQANNGENANLFNAHPLVMQTRTASETAAALERMARTVRDTLPDAGDA